MQIIEAIKARASTRAFLDKPVSDTIVENILDAARFAPSGKNTQPWHVSVVMGDTKQRISQQLLQAYHKGEAPCPDYHYYADKLLVEQKQRAVACGMALYGALGIDRQDKVARGQVWEWNYEFFSAPVGLLIWLNRAEGDGKWFDVGAFCQTLMLAALEYDLATCAQASIAEYPDLIRAELKGVYDNHILVCGIALGYPDKQAPVNNYRTERMALDKFVRWYN